MFGIVAMPGIGIGDRFESSVASRAPVFPPLGHLVIAKRRLFNSRHVNRTGYRTAVVRPAGSSSEQLAFDTLLAQTVGAFSTRRLGLKPWSSTYRIATLARSWGERLHNRPPSPPALWKRASLVVAATFHCNAGRLADMSLTYYNSRVRHGHAPTPSSSFPAARVGAHGRVVASHATSSAPT